MVIFHSYVSLPEGNLSEWKLIFEFMGVDLSEWISMGSYPRVNVYIDVENPWGKTLGK